MPPFSGSGICSRRVTVFAAAVRRTTVASSESRSCGCHGSESRDSRSDARASGRRRCPRGRGAASDRDGVLADQMQADHARSPVLVEVAEHGVSRHFLKIVPVLSLRVDAVPERPGVVPACDRLRDLEDDLYRSHPLLRRCTPVVLRCGVGFGFP